MIGPATAAGNSALAIGTPETRLFFDPQKTTTIWSATARPAAFAAAQAAGEIQEDEPGPAFGLLSIAATLVALVLVYLICVQAFPSLGLSWPGQVPTLH